MKVKTSTMKPYFISVSIPEGAIEGCEMSDGANALHKVSIPEGAIEGKEFFSELDKGMKFQYPKVRLKANELAITVGEKLCFNTRRCD